MEEDNAVFIGDGVYIKNHKDGILIYADDCRRGPTDLIFLEPAVIKELIAYAKSNILKDGE